MTRIGIKDRIKKYEETGTSDEELVEIEVEDEKQKKWNCESILPAYSNIYNQPTVVLPTNGFSRFFLFD